MKMTIADKLWMQIFDHRGIKVSKEWAIDEVAHCAEDYEYFIDTYCLIKNRAEEVDALPPGTIVYGDVIDFKLFEIQKEYLNTIVTNQNTSAIKTRQSGISLTTGLYILQRGTFESSKEIIVISKSERESIKFLDELKFSHMYLPFFLRRRVTGNMKKMVLGTKYQHTIIRALPGGKDAGRSYTATMLVLDEAAFIEGVDNIWSAAAPTLSTTGGKAVIISTPWEDEGLFYDTIEGARENMNDFAIIEVPWESIPGRDEEWYAKQCAKLNHVEEKIQTELDMKFISKGTAFFAMEKMREKSKMKPVANIMNENITLTDPLQDNYGLNDFYDRISIPLNGKGFIYEFPKKDVTYMVGHDPAEDGTSSCNGITVFRVDGFPKENPKVVLEWRTKSMVMDTLIDLAEFYNNAITIVEKNRGYAVIMHFVAADKEHLLLKRPNGETGLVTNTASRQILLKLLNKYFVADIDEMPLMLFDESKGFVRNKSGKLKGKKFDDLLFSSGIALLGLATFPDMILPQFEEINTDERLKLLEAMNNLTTDRQLATVTSNRYMTQLKTRLFGDDNKSNTNLSGEDLKRLQSLLPV